MPGRLSFLRQALILWAAGLVGVVAVMPYAFLLHPDSLEKANSRGLTFPVLIGLSLLQNGVLLAIVVPVGLWAAARLSLRSPLSEALATGGNLRAVVRTFLWTSVISGAATGVVLWLLEAFVFAPFLPSEFAAFRRSITWQGLPASLYGGVTEELFMRLFLLSLLSLALRRLLVPSAPGLPAAPFWAANCVIALVFGLGHIAGMFTSIPLTPAVWFYAILLNGICGIVFGWLYWQKGLEAAMLAHFTVDIILHVIGPVFKG